MQGVLTGEQDLEERAVFAGERIEGPRLPAVWSGGGASDGVELADGRGRVVDAGESVEVAGVALRRNFLIAEEEGDPKSSVAVCSCTHGSSTLSSAGWDPTTKMAKSDPLTLRSWCPGAESNHRHGDFQALGPSEKSPLRTGDVRQAPFKTRQDRYAEARSCAVLRQLDGSRR